MKPFWIFLLAATLSLTAQADQDAIVVAEPSFVYKKPDFDARQIGELRINQRIRVSTKKFGAFYRTRTSQNVMGYVSDADVRVGGSGGGTPGAAGKNHGESQESSPSEARVGVKPWWTKWMVGGVFGYMRYAEVFNREEKSSLGLVYGGKMTIPLRFLGTYSLDVSVQGSLRAPQFYRDVALGTPSGSFWLFEFPLLFQLAHFWGRDGTIWVGAGPMGALSQFKFEAINGSIQDLQEIRVGAVFTVVFGFQVGPVILKLEPRYYAEKINTWSVLSAAQYAF